MSAETFCRWQIVACNVVNSALYLRHSLGGSAVCVSMCVVYGV